MKTGFLVAVLAMAAFAADNKGLKPRPGPADYPSHDTVGDVTLAASILTPDQVKATFSTELKNYLVLEVAVYPAAGKSVDLSTGDFVLRAGDRGALTRPANPRAIAASNQRKSAQPQQPAGGRDITLYPTATVGVASGTDPWTGRRNTGVYTGAGVGVGVGGSPNGMPDPPRPASTDRDRGVMQEELTDQMVPEGATTSPVAGYLYFPMPPKARTTALELHYYTASGKVQVSLPPLPRTK